MNAELQRNLWLEFSHRRVVFMVVSLGLLFMFGNSGLGPSGLGTTAEYAFYGIVVIWGARNAAEAVVGEIRDRTWDGQRLSSLSPFAMTWGKLLGPTSYAWAGGMFCLVVLAWTAFTQGGAGAVIGDLSYFLMIDRHRDSTGTARGSSVRNRAARSLGIPRETTRASTTSMPPSGSRPALEPPSPSKFPRPKSPRRDPTRGVPPLC